MSEATEDYLKAIYSLRESGDKIEVTTQRLAQALGVSSPSASAMVKKLTVQGLVKHAPYKAIELTPAGERAALEMIRHHRLIETFLVEILGVPWDEVHSEAERWEHVLSEEIEARMAESLNHPTHNPHGSPIPSLEGIMARENYISLSELEVGIEREVRRVNDEDSALLRHLGELGLRPGARVTVTRHEAAEDMLHLEVDGQPRVLGARPARSIWMAKP